MEEKKKKRELVIVRLRRPYKARLKGTTEGREIRMMILLSFFRLGKTHRHRRRGAQHNAKRQRDPDPAAMIEKTQGEEEKDFVIMI